MDVVVTRETETVCNTTLHDGSKDVVRVVFDDIRQDVSGVVKTYGKYAIYGAVAFLGWQVYQMFVKQ